MDMGLVLMFPVKVLVRFMGVFHGRMIVLVGMLCYQMLNLFLSTAFSVMGYLDVLMSMNHFFVGMALKLSSSHPETSCYKLFVGSEGGASDEVRPSWIWPSAARPPVTCRRLALLDSTPGKAILKTPFS
jgi:hypothetical protein